VDRDQYKKDLLQKRKGEDEVLAEMAEKSLQDDTKRRMTEPFSFKCSTSKQDEAKEITAKSSTRKRQRESKTRSKKDEESTKTNNTFIQKRINDNMNAFEGKSFGDILSQAKNNSPYKNRFNKNTKHITQESNTSSLQNRNILKERELENLKAFGGAGLGEVISSNVKTNNK